MLFKNKKNQKTYRMLDVQVHNATNAQDDQRMVLYVPVGKGLKNYLACILMDFLFSGKFYVREFEEFVDKFDRVVDIK